MFRLGSSLHKTVCLGGTSAKGVSSSSLLCKHSASQVLPCIELEELEAQMQKPYIREGPNYAWPLLSLVLENLFCWRSESNGGDVANRSSIMHTRRQKRQGGSGRPQPTQTINGMFCILCSCFCPSFWLSLASLPSPEME